MAMNEHGARSRGGFGRRGAGDLHHRDAGAWGTSLTGTGEVQRRERRRQRRRKRRRRDRHDDFATDDD
jgi:hypothetical protein